MLDVPKIVDFLEGQEARGNEGRITPEYAESHGISRDVAELCAGDIIAEAFLGGVILGKQEAAAEAAATAITSETT